MHLHKQRKLPILTLFVFALTILVSCNKRVNDLIEFLDVKEGIYEDISIQMGDAYWNLYSDEGVADLETPKLRYAELFTNDTLNDLIDEWYNKRSELKDPVIKRRVEMWHNILTAAKVNYAKENLKLQNDLEYWLTEEDSIGGKPSDEELKNMVIRLMKLRNDKAQELDYGDYGELILEVTEFGSEWLVDFAEKLDSRTLESYQKLIDEYKSENNVSEFNYSDARSMVSQYFINRVVPEIKSDSIMSTINTIMDTIGFDFNNLPFRFVENEMPPGVGGQGIAVQIPNDFRIALLPDMDIMTWMHELGHGLQAMNTTIKSPILKGYEWSLGSCNGGYAEGMGEMSAKFVLNSEWIKRLTNLTESEMDEMSDISNSYLPTLLRFYLSIFMFEVEFYKNLDQDPIELKRQLTQKYLLLDNPPERVRPIVDMAYVSYPLYIQNYTIAEIISWQVHSTLKEKFGNEYALNSNVAHFLNKNFYTDGELYSWQQRLKNATGRELDLDGYLTELGL